MSTAEPKLGPMDEFVLGLSTRQARRLIELLLLIFVQRPADATEENKYAARTEMKRLAKFLKQADASWTMQEVTLNLARALYYSEGEFHSYYTENLIELVQRSSETISRPELGAAFEAAVKEMQKWKGHTDLILGDDLIKADAAVRTTATEVVVAVLRQEGTAFYTKSEKDALQGVVYPQAVRLLAQ